ncbi:MAG: C39 family peptidase [Candidatus Shapirobacteria bacterium]|nr:C39 family peptidase [Candidatus Shapirobacteria bacterium]
MKPLRILYILLPLSLLASLWVLSKNINLSAKINNKTQQLSQTIDRVVETATPKPTIIEKNGLPNAHLIKTAFIQQAPEKNWDLPWQDTCEEASLLTLDFYYKNQSPSLTDQKQAILNMLDFETSQNYPIDINISQMAIVASNYLHLTPKIIDNPTLDQIKQSIAANIPVIVPANGKILFAQNSHFKSGGPWYHNIVILGYDDLRQEFIVHDVGTQFGAYFHYSYGLLMNAIHDFPASLTKEDINSGTPRILILLK